MAQYPKPSNNYPTFSQGTFTNPTTGGLTIDEGKKYFLTFPTQQANSTETMSTVLIQGTLGVAQTATFNNTTDTAIHSIGDVILDGALNVDGVTTLGGDLDITDSNIILDGVYLTNYIQFPDGTKQYSADTGVSTYTVLNNQDNTYVAGFNQTFVGDIGSVGVNGPIVFTNTTSTGGTGSIYVDPDNTTDITIYSAQSTNAGLTVRNPTNSYTINPATINGTNNWANFLNPINSALGINAGYVNINGTSSSTLNVYAPSSTINYTQIRQENGSSTVIANSYWDGTSGGGIFFQFRNSTGYGSPFYITSGLVSCLPTLTCYSAINAPQYNLSTSVGGSGINFKYYASGVASMNILGVDTFAIQNTGNNIMTFNYNDINAYKDINMNNNDINNCNSVNSSGTLTLTATTGITASVPITIPYNGVYPQINTYTAANIAYVNDGLYYKAPLASPAFTGTPTAPIPANNNIPAQIATTGYVVSVAPSVLDFSFIGFVTSSGGVDSSVTCTSLLPVEYSDLILAGYNNYIGGDITWTQNSPTLAYLYLAFNSKPANVWPDTTAGTGTISFVVTDNTTKTSYTGLYFTTFSSVPGFSYVMQITCQAFISSANNGHSFSLNLSTLQAFK
jgi:hypothetical protein